MEHKATKKMKKNGRELRQNAFLQAYRANLFNISAACRAVGVHRSNFYRWLNGDTGFAERLKLVQEEKLDFIESKLMEQIESGNVVAIIFALKCLGKGRGYTEQHDLRLTAGNESFTKEERDRAVQAALKAYSVRQKQIPAGDKNAVPVIDIKPSEGRSGQKDDV
jgi:transposase-like protein